MKTSLICPKCQSKRLWIIDKMAQPWEHSSVAPPLMRVHFVEYVTPMGAWKNVEVGTLEAWVCANCNYMELYGRDCNAALAELAARPNSGVRFIDTTAQRGPFR